MSALLRSRAAELLPNWISARKLSGKPPGPAPDPVPDPQPTPPPGPNPAPRPPLI
jgi:hypothetical protein